MTSDVSPQNLAARFQAGLACHQRGQLTEARRVYEEVLEAAPTHFDALHLLGVLALQNNNPAEAAALIGKAIAANPASPLQADAYVNRASALKALKDLDAALACTDQAIVLRPDHAPAHYNRGNILRELGRLSEAIASFHASLQIAGNNAEAFYNLGLCQADLGENAGAVACFQTALELGAPPAEVHSRLAFALRALDLGAEALASFNAVIALRPKDALAYSNRGVVLQDLGRNDEALADYNAALALSPNAAAVYGNRGVLLRLQGKLEAAAADFAEAVKRRPDSAKDHYNLATTLGELKRYADADAAFTRVVELDPQYPFAFGAWLHGRMMLCAWNGYQSNVARLEEMVARGLPVTPTLALIGLSDSLALHSKAAAVWAADKCPPDASLGPIAPQAGDKIRLEYFSADFRQHPVAALSAGLFEAHDRARLEVIAFSTGSGDGDPMHRRLKAAFDRFIDVRGQSDAEIAALARSLKIDIAIDLTGYTGGARTGIFARRAAPVQVSYLGYPGTMGASFIDYMIADRTLVPATAQPFYTEKMAYLTSFQVNDRKREAPAQPFTRAALGLPEAGFVFACFNNPFKITPPVFDAWMRILKAAPGAVLFLTAEGVAAANLKREAAARGIEAARVIIGGKVPTAEYWARLRAADLFLDTFPFGAHSSASDALWAGLPLLTCAGESYAARVAASLLTALGVPELIAADRAAYEARAIALAQDAAQLGALKQRITANRLTTPLFDTSGFTRAIEAAFTEMLRRQRAGLPPDHFTV